MLILLLFYLRLPKFNINFFPKITKESGSPPVKDDFSLLEPSPENQEINENQKVKMEEKFDPQENQPLEEQPLEEQPLVEQPLVEQPNKESGTIPTAKKRKTNKISLMDVNFYYDYESMVFKPVMSEESNISEDLLQLL